MGEKNGVPVVWRRLSEVPMAREEVCIVGFRFSSLWGRCF